MVISPDNVLTIIDFNRFDFGDLWEEFNRIARSAAASLHFATGQINSYFGGKSPIEFFKLLALYISSNTLSAIYGAIPFGEKEIRKVKNDIIWIYNKYWEGIEMIYYKDDNLCIRTMIKDDIEKFVNGFAEQNWRKPYELFNDYYNQQGNNQRVIIVAEINGDVAGYVTLISKATGGPFANKGIPEIVDFNVLIKYQKRGIGNKIMDVVESLAKEQNSFISLSVGLHYGYGSAQRMYVKRGYIPDGTGVWYKGEQLEQYSKCENDDSLTLYLIKSLS